MKSALNQINTEFLRRLESPLMTINAACHKGISSNASIDLLKTINVEINKLNKIIVDNTKNIKNIDNLNIVYSNKFNLDDAVFQKENVTDSILATLNMIHTQSQISNPQNSINWFTSNSALLSSIPHNKILQSILNPILQVSVKDITNGIDIYVKGVLNTTLPNPNNTKRGSIISKDNNIDSETGELLFIVIFENYPDQSISLFQSIMLNVLQSITQLIKENNGSCNIRYSPNNNLETATVEKIEGFEFRIPFTLINESNIITSVDSSNKNNQYNNVIYHKDENMSTDQVPLSKEQLNGNYTNYFKQEEMRIAVDISSTNSYEVDIEEESILRYSDYIEYQLSNSSAPRPMSLIPIDNPPVHMDSTAIRSKSTSSTQLSLKPNISNENTGNTSKYTSLFSSMQSRNFKVLIVDDNVNVQRVLRSWMTSHGCTITIAKNGKLGLALLKSEPFDLVMMDFLMPVMLGIDAIQAFHIWKQSATSNTQSGTTGNTLNTNTLILGMSKGESLNELSFAFQTGMHIFSPKPMNTSDLELIIAAKINIQNLEDIIKHIHQQKNTQLLTKYNKIVSNLPIRRVASNFCLQDDMLQDMKIKRLDSDSDETKADFVAKNMNSYVTTVKAISNKNSHQSLKNNYEIDLDFQDSKSPNKSREGSISDMNQVFDSSYQELNSFRSSWSTGVQSTNTSQINTNAILLTAKAVANAMSASNSEKISKISTENATVATTKSRDNTIITPTRGGGGGGGGSSSPNTITNSRKITSGTTNTTTTTTTIISGSLVNPTQITPLSAGEEASVLLAPGKVIGRTTSGSTGGKERSASPGSGWRLFSPNSSHSKIVPTP